MASLAFPKMFIANKVKVVEESTATLQDISLLLNTKLKEFQGDPTYGTKLVALLFKNNSTALKSVIKDVICDTITKYIPLVTIDRNNIEITLTISTMIVSITVYNNGTGQNDLYNINITNTES